MKTKPEVKTLSTNQRHMIQVTSNVTNFCRSGSQFCIISIIQ